MQKSQLCISWPLDVSLIVSRIFNNKTSGCHISKSKFMWYRGTYTPNDNFWYSPRLLLLMPEANEKTYV